MPFRPSEPFDAATSPPRQPTTIPPTTSTAHSSGGRKLHRRQVRSLPRAAPDSGRAARKTPPPARPARSSAPMPPCSTPSITNGPADVDLRRADELHDFELVAPRVQRQPDDVGDRQRGGDASGRTPSTRPTPRTIVDRPTAAASATGGRSGRRRRPASAAAARQRVDAGLRAAVAGRSRTSYDAGSGLSPSVVDRRRRDRANVCLNRSQRVVLRHELAARPRPRRARATLRSRVRSAAVASSLRYTDISAARLHSAPSRCEIRGHDQECRRARRARAAIVRGRQQARLAPAPQARRSLRRTRSGSARIRRPRRRGRGRA